ncbi:hypothetical protein ABIA42_001924 [Bradyrhizobium sp. USDA 327]
MVRDVGVRFKHANGFAEMVVLQGPAGIDREYGTVLRALLNPAFPSPGIEQGGLDDFPPVGIAGSQKLVGDLPECLVGGPAVGLFRSLVPEIDHAGAIPDEDHVMREVEQASLRRQAIGCGMILEREQRGDCDGR